MLVLCQVFLQYSSYSTSITKGIFMNTCTLPGAFSYRLRFHMQVPGGGEVEDQEKHLAYLSEIEHARKAIGRDHERVVDDHIRDDDQAIRNQAQVDGNPQQDDCQGIDYRKERPIDVEQERDRIIEPLVGEKAMQDEIHHMIVRGPKKRCRVHDEK
jgi:hypothetical protein